MRFKEIIQNRQDRLIAFFDAILAIAITVLALEITVPSLGNIGDSERGEFLVSFTCYLISFIAMAVLWYTHSLFFSNYSLTGSYTEIILHLVLLFVITLFQPMTRAIGLYRSDSVVHILYLLTFASMFILNIAILLLVKRNSKRIESKKAWRNTLYKKFVKENENLTDEQSRFLMMAYMSANQDEALEILKEKLPEEYAQILKEHEEARRESFRISVITTAETILFICGAVVALMFSIPACYIVLVVGIVVVVLTNILLRASSR